MKQKIGLLLFGLAAIGATIYLAQAQGDKPVEKIVAITPNESDKAPVTKIEKSEAEWKAALSSEQFKILRQKGTELSGSSPLLNEHRPGVFHCAACGLPLFSSDTKFVSGTGWPSFWKPFVAANVFTAQDNSLGMERDEVLCARCGGHLGHVFDDGPKPTGLRYCLNGAALKFEPRQ